MSRDTRSNRRVSSRGTTESENNSGKPLIKLRSMSTLLRNEKPRKKGHILKKELKKNLEKTRSLPPSEGEVIDVLESIVNRKVVYEPCERKSLGEKSDPGASIDPESYFSTPKFGKVYPSANEKVVGKNNNTLKYSDVTPIEINEPDILVPKLKNYTTIDYNLPKLDKTKINHIPSIYGKVYVKKPRIV